MRLFRTYKKNIYLLLSILFGFFLYLLFPYIDFGKPVIAQEAIPMPTPTPFPCNETSDNEFHSLRPYQASPCNPDAEDLALFCGNDLVLLDPIVIEKRYSDGNMIPSLDWKYFFEGNEIQPFPPISGGSDFFFSCKYCNGSGQCVDRNISACIPDVGCKDNNDCAASECIDNGNGTETCYFIIDRVRDIAVDLREAYFPIMGFTEPSLGNESDPYKVVNSLFQGDETVDDPTKVNEYVSWYINGLIGRAEYNPPDTNLLGGLSEEGEKRLVDFSGPLKRLLSWESQIVRRGEEVRKAQRSINCDPNAVPKDPNCIRHDQIIGCTNLLGHPAGCYTNIIKDKIRLTDWISKFNLPQLRRNFGTWEDFWSAYLSWRADNPWRLFTYIPFSSTEDRLGNVEIDDYAIQPSNPNDVVIIDSSIINQEPADLFFAHMQESFELADLLQQVYSPQEADLDAEPGSSYVPYDKFCDLTEVRTNPGDDLFAGELSATVAYTAQVACTFTKAVAGEGRVCEASGGNCEPLPQEDLDCTTYYGQVDCGDNEFCGVGCGSWPSPPGCLGEDETCEMFGTPIGECCGGLECSGNITVYKKCEPITVDISAFDFTETCSNTVAVNFKTITKTPLAKEVWSKLVAGPSSVFKRMFPKIEDVEGRPIRRLWAIPGATPVDFIPLTPGLSIRAGNNRIPGQAELYFRYIGGIHQYFLQCMQTALRPQGYGQGCLSASAQPIPPAECPFTEIPPLPTESSCKLSHTQIRNETIPDLMRKVFESAGSQYNVPPDLIAALMYAEGGFEPRVANPSCYGRYTQENITNAVLCEFPNCNPTYYDPPCNYNANQGDFCYVGGGAFGPYQQCPSGYNPCNFYEATMNMAEWLANNHKALFNLANSPCKPGSINYDLSDPAGGGSSCQKSSWSCEDVVTALVNWAGSCNPADHTVNALTIYGSCL